LLKGNQSLYLKKTLLTNKKKNTSANQRTIFPIHNDKNKKGIIDISEPNPILKSKKIETKTENIIAEKPPEKIITNTRGQKQLEIVKQRKKILV